LPFLIGDDGIAWIGYWPARVVYTDANWRMWRLPRHWLTEGVSPVIEASRYDVIQVTIGKTPAMTTKQRRSAVNQCNLLRKFFNRVGVLSGIGLSPDEL
jgi:hypothetical protein